MSAERDGKVSRALQGVAGRLDTQLAAVAGEPVGFVLLVMPLNEDDGRLQYVANIEREGFVRVLKNLLQLLEEGKRPGAAPQVPFHDLQ